jgi:hypothetical protein
MESLMIYGAMEYKKLPDSSYFRIILKDNQQHVNHAHEKGRDKNDEDIWTPGAHFESTSTRFGHDFGWLNLSLTIKVTCHKNRFVAKIESKRDDIHQ